MIVGRIEAALDAPAVRRQKGKINLILTSPPFPLVRKKRYGNEVGETYLGWLSSLAPRLSDLLTPDGSIVIEIGNAWVEGLPTMSTLSLEALLAFKKASGLHLCQHIICHNPARLPSPAQWVNVDRIRLKDSFTHVWWLSLTEFPKADNRRVLLPYSSTMKQLLKSQSYNSGRRPSGHKISKTGFLKDHGGAIAPNVLDFNPDDKRLPTGLLKFSGTAWDAGYRDFCETHKLPQHPARMQSELAAFFIQFLTEKKDLIFDPFAGSNTTGAVAEKLGRRWLSVEANPDYAKGSKGRFAPNNKTKSPKSKRKDT
jgi:DNA modification methylase